MSRFRLPPTLWVVLGASAMTTLGTLPVFLLSSQSVFVRRELDFDERLFGVAVSAFFVSAAASALLGGGLVDRLGRRRGTMVAGLMAAAGGFGVAGLVHSWPALMAGMVLLGMTNAVCQVTSNLAMARAVPAHRRGLGFGVKQAAIPVAIMLSGLAVPLVGAAVGWRWTFALTGGAGLVLAGWGLRLPRHEDARVNADEALDQPPRAALLTTMAAILLASAAANSLGSFLASWGYHVGLTPSQAGALMAVGSGLNVLVRVGSGHLADRRHGRNLPVVALQMAIGAVALAALALPVPASVVGAALVAFALGWSWPGLLLYAVVRIGRDAPARASGVIQAGAFAGGAAGPAVFGVVVAAAGYSTAWLCAAGLFGAAALLIVVARRMFIADLVARPPARPLGYGGGRTSPARTTHPEQGAR